MGGKLEIYLDIASLYSYVAFAYLQQHASELAAHGVEIDCHPVLLGAINHSSGNRPPWVLPAKAAYLKLDSARSLARVSLPPTITMPPDFLTRANTLLPLRCLTHLKSVLAQPQYLALFSHLFHSFWQDQSPISTSPEALASALQSATLNSSPIFSSPSQVTSAIAAANTPRVKTALKLRTQEAVDRGAFGAPWIWATNSAGDAQPFFGSDRFHFVYRHLGVPFQDVSILMPPPTVLSGTEERANEERLGDQGVEKSKL